MQHEIKPGSATQSSSPKVTEGILVTGGTGFLGSYIIKALVEKGYPVRAIRRGNKLPGWISKEILDKVEWVEGDILDVVSLEEAMEGVDTIIHSRSNCIICKKTASICTR